MSSERSTDCGKLGRRRNVVGGSQQHALGGRGVCGPDVAVVSKMGVHKGADSGSQGLRARSKKRNAAKAHGSLKLQILKKGGT